jgi:hypothetical protein
MVFTTAFIKGPGGYSSAGARGIRRHLLLGKYRFSPLPPSKRGAKGGVLSKRGMQGGVLSPNRAQGGAGCVAIIKKSFSGILRRAATGKCGAFL